MIQVDKLKGYKRFSSISNDYLVSTFDNKYDVCFYNVEERSMLSYYCRFAIIFTKEVLIASGDVAISYHDENTFFYAEKSNCFVFKMPAFIHQKETKYIFPYLLIKPQDEMFAFIKWDASSLYYGFEELSANILKVKETYPEKLQSLNIPSRAGEIVNLDYLTWYSSSDLDNARRIYSTSL